MAPTSLLCFAAAGDENLENRPPIIPKTTETPSGAPHSPRLSSDKDRAQKPQGTAARAWGSALQWSAREQREVGRPGTSLPSPGDIKQTPETIVPLSAPQVSRGLIYSPARRREKFPLRVLVQVPAGLVELLGTADPWTPFPALLKWAQCCFFPHFPLFKSL